jgi:hypothetical protein
MKLYKQKVTMYYNKKHQTFGTLWADRFKSQLVEDGGIALQTVAAYIDLNGVRAGLVQDPKDYRFCGYAEAVAGNVELQRQHARTMAGELVTDAAHVADRLAQYRLWVMQEGASLSGVEKKTRGVSEPVVAAAEKVGGKLTQAELLRHKVRYFIDGAAIGGGEFVEKVFAVNRSLFGAKRETGARSMRGADWGPLKILRDLRKDPIS